MLRILALGILVMSLGDALAADELKVGDPAPDFKLEGSDGKTYALADYRGKQPLVLAWFPRAFTPGCTIECKAMKTGGEPLRKLNVAYFTASTDSVEKNKEFAKSLELDYPILSDPEATAAKAYGVAQGAGKPASRWTFYISAEGKILYIDKQVKPATAAEDVAARLKQLGLAK